MSPPGRQNKTLETLNTELIRQPPPSSRLPAVLCGGSIWNLLTVAQATQGGRVLIGGCQ